MKNLGKDGAKPRVDVGSSSACQDPSLIFLGQHTPEFLGYMSAE